MSVVAFHNSIGLTGPELVAANVGASSQDAAVLDVFRRAGRPLTPSDVWRLTSDAGHLWPLTSIRRAITNLTNDDLLVKLDLQRTGIYGRPEGLWQLPAGQGELFGVAA